MFEETNDPIEPTNRIFFDFNISFDRLFFKPIATAYREAVPQLARDGVRNILRNARTPVIFANDVLQGESGRAAETLMRAAVNSSAGFAGFFDVAGHLGLKYHNEDFGQTLAVWGVSEGPYLMIPILGPSTVRDAIGQAVDRAFDPLYYLGQFVNPEELQIYNPVSQAAEGVDVRSRNIENVDELERTSIDFYAAIRSLYRQSRDDEIRNGKIEIEDLPAPDIILDDEDL